MKEGKPNHPEDRGDPQERGEEERFFGTLNTRLWSTLEGYVHSNTKERNPNVKATYTITELAQKLDAFLDEYHHSVHSETKMTPLEFWATKCQAREDAPPRNLDVLLLAAVTRTLNKDHIHYGNRRYWHDDLAEIPVGAKVEVRAQPDYMRPNEIEVFYNGHHLCTAFAHDSVKGREVTGARVLAAQRRQTQRIRATIRQKKNALQNADRQIKAQQELLQQPESGTPAPPDDQIAKQEGQGVQETPMPPNPQGQANTSLGGQSSRSPSEANKQSVRASSRSSRSQRSPWAIALEVQERQHMQEEKKEQL